jgi:hypothetical protein
VFVYAIQLAAKKKEVDDRNLWLQAKDKEVRVGPGGDPRIRRLE